MSLNGTIKRLADRFYQWMSDNEIARMMKGLPPRGSDMSGMAVSTRASSLSGILAHHLHNQIVINIAVVLPGDHKTKSERGISVESEASSTVASTISDEMNDMESSVMAKIKKVGHVIVKIVIAPLEFLSMITIPNCKKENREKWWPVTFLTAIIWIAIYSYILVWMMTIIGFTVGIPDTVMGLTLLAGTVALPDLVATLVVVKRGQGNMGVSNAIASNIFETLMGMGLPWLMKTTIASPGSVVPVASGGLEYTSMGILVTIIYFLAVIHFSGWQLNKKMGTGLIAWYVGAVALAVCVEMNLFGTINLPVCTSIS